MTHPPPETPAQDTPDRDGAGVLAALPDVVLYASHHPHHRITAVYGPVEALTGCSAAQLLADPDLTRRVLHPNDQARGRRLGVVGEGTSTRIQRLRCVHPDGRVVWVEQHVHVVTDGGGRHSSTLAVLRDITDRERHRLAQALRVALLGVRQVGGVGLDASMRAATYHLGDLLDASHVRIAIREPVRVEVATQLAPRRSVTSADEVQPLILEQTLPTLGGVTGTLTLRWDIPVRTGRTLDERVTQTARMLAQAVISAREHDDAVLQGRILDTTANGVVITDREGTILWVNAAVETITGYARHQVIGQNPRIWNSGVHERVVFQELWDTVLTGSVWRGELVNRRVDGTLRIMHLTVTPIVEASTVVRLVAVMDDITDRRAADEAGRRSQQQLRTLIAALPAVVLTVSRDGVISHAEGPTEAVLDE